MKDPQSRSTLFRLMWVVLPVVLLPLGLGLWLDQLFSASPLFALVGGLLGILTATAGVVRVTGRALESIGGPTQAPPDEVGRKENEEQ